MELSNEKKGFLLKLARDTIKATLDHKPSPNQNRGPYFIKPLWGLCYFE
jgi:hypothetical protein